MPESVITKKHISIAKYCDIKQICRPLLENTKIDNYFYARFYPDNKSLIVFDTNLHFHKSLYLEHNLQELPRYDFFDTIIKTHMHPLYCNKNQGFWFVDEVSQNSILEKLSFFQINKFAAYGTKYHDYIEVLGVSTKDAELSYSYYYNNFDIIHKFTRYFVEKSADLIQQYEKNRIILPLSSNCYLQHVKKLQNLHANSADKVDLLERFAVKKHILYVKKKIKIELTQKEFFCLHYLAMGKTYKGVARELNVSPRTVETHIENVKHKAGLYTKQELIEMYWDNYNPGLKI